MIRVSKETREKLASIGSKRDTYEKIIQNLLESKGSTLSPSEGNNQTRRFNV